MNPVTFTDDLDAERDRLERDLASATATVDQMTEANDGLWQRIKDLEKELAEKDLALTTERMENNRLRAVMRDVADDVKDAMDTLEKIINA